MHVTFTYRCALWSVNNLQHTFS